MICSCCGKEKKTASQKKTCKKCRQKLKRRRISKAQAFDMSNNSNWFDSSSPQLDESKPRPIISNKPNNDKAYLKNEEFDSQRTIDIPDSQLTVEMSSQNDYGDPVYDEVSSEQNTGEQSNYEVSIQIQQDEVLRTKGIDLVEKTQEGLEDIEDDNNSMDESNFEIEYDNFQDDYSDPSYIESESQDSIENSIDVEENLPEPSNNGANLPTIGEIEELLEGSDISIDNWAKVAVNKKTGNIIDIHTTERWLKYIVPTASIYSKALAKEMVLKAVPENNYQIIKSGFIPRPINFAKMYDLQYCPDCTRLKSIQNHFSHRIPSSLRDKCTYRGPFKLGQGHRIGLTYIMLSNVHEFPEISSSIKNKLTNPQLTRELTEYILSGNKYLEDINFKQNIIDKYHKEFKFLLLQLPTASDKINELRQSLVDRMVEISEYARLNHEVGQSLFKKFRNVRKETVIMYTNIVFKILYTMIKLQDLGYLRLFDINDKAEDIGCIEVVTNYFDNKLMLYKINPVGYEFQTSPFIVALWLNHLDPVDHCLRDESGIQHLFDATQLFMKLELINYCRTNHKNMELEYKEYFKATEDYTTIYKILRIMKGRLFDFRTIVSNYYDVYFTKKYTTMLYKEKEIHLSDVPEFVVFLIESFCNTILPILPDHFKIKDFIERVYDPNFYSSLSCFAPLHSFRERLPFVLLETADDLRRVLCFNFFKLNKLIILIMYFTGGLPFRMTEVLGLQFNDKKRNIFFRGGKMVCTYTYNKTDNISNKTKLISRGYPIIVSKIVFFYINYVRYYELRLMEQLKQLDNNKSRWETLQERCTRYLFVDISGIVQLEDMYALFMQMSTKFIKTRLGIRDWRQIMVQFVKKNVSSTSMLSSSFIHKFLEMQAGHGSTVALNSYEKTTTRDYENGIVEAQQLMSERWHEIINLPLSLNELENFKPNIQLSSKEIN